MLSWVGIVVDKVVGWGRMSFALQDTAGALQSVLVRLVRPQSVVLLSVVLPLQMKYKRDETTPLGMT